MKNRSFILFLLFAFINAAGFSQSKYQDKDELPKGKKGEIIIDFIESYNSFDADTFTNFVEQDFSEHFLNAFSLQSHVQYYTEYQHYLGKYTFECIRVYQENKDPNKLYFLLKNEYFNSFLEFRIEYEQQSGKIDKLSFSAFEPAAPPSYLDKSNLTEDQFLANAEKLVTKLSKNDAFSGTALIAKKDSILYEYVTGESSKSYHAANNIDTKINLGSMNKMFTATGILKLVEQEKLSLTDTISKYVDTSWFDISILDKITIEQLLTHTSGLGNFFNEDFLNSSRDLYRNVNDFKKLLKNDTLLFEPGTRFEYSNIGFVLLGVIIEDVTGQNYFDYMKDNIYLPLGMNNTDCYDMDIPHENLAIGYISSDNDEKWKNNLFLHVIKGGPSGGGFSTVRDLHKFALALLENKILTKESTELMWTIQQDAGRFGKGLGYESYGYGTMIKNEENKQAVGHLGGFPGISAGLTIFPHDDYIICVLSNYDHVGIILSNHLKKMAFQVN